MRVLMTTPRFFPETGGIETHIFQVGKRLAEQGHTIKVLTTDRSGRLPVEETIQGIQVKRVPAWPQNQDFYFAPDIFHQILKSEWDILHIQSYHTFVPPLGMLAALKARRPFVLTFHGGGHSSQLRHSLRKVQRFLLRPLLMRAEKLIAVARFEIKMFAHELNIPVNQFELIPNGSDIPQIKPRTNDRSGEIDLIASVGRLERYKGHQRVIAALPLVLQQRPKAHLWIAGSGPYEKDLWDFARKLGVQEKITIQSYPPDMRDEFIRALSEASLFILFSEYETHPIAALEAISLGCPALVSDSSGLGEIADDGLAKSLPLDCTNEELATEIIERLNHPIYPKEVHLPTWDDCASNLLNLYKSIVEA